MPERECNQCGKRFDAPLTGQHRFLCGDARDSGDVERLFAGARANIVITSPPYASQRKYDESSEFRPVPPDQYVGWFQAAALNIAAVLAAGGSFFLNIKEHADDGERDLYVMDLVIAHRRQWGWRLVDTFCWRKTDNGVPGGWENRFKNAWEPVFHFCRQKSIKFRPKAGRPCFRRLLRVLPEQSQIDLRERLAGHRSAWRFRRQVGRGVRRWPPRGNGAPQQRDRGEDRDEPGFALRTVSPGAG